MSAAELPMRRVTVEDVCTVEIPEAWAILRSQPTVVMPKRWDGEPPAVVVQHEDDSLRGAALAGAILQSVQRLDDAVVLDIRLDESWRDVELLVAHRSRGVAVTTLERHHCQAAGRWVVAFSATDGDWVDLVPVASRVVASVEVAR
jgi:hypothetical protein